MLSWDSLHPLIIHFPIALLLLTPLFIVVGVIVSPLKGRSFLATAVMLMLLGTISLFFAVETGEAAAQLADQTPPVGDVLRQHQELATITRNLFLGLSIIGVPVLLLPRFLPTHRVVFTRILPVSFLVFYTVGILFLVNTADRGGRLVHELGVHAVISPTTEKPAAMPVGSERQESGLR
jgi:uncharacterized membrane protein